MDDSLYLKASDIPDVDNSSLPALLSEFQIPPLPAASQAASVTLGPELFVSVSQSTAISCSASIRNGAVIPQATEHSNVQSLQMSTHKTSKAVPKATSYIKPKIPSDFCETPNSTFKTSSDTLNTPSTSTKASSAMVNASGTMVRTTSAFADASHASTKTTSATLNTPKFLSKPAHSILNTPFCTFCKSNGEREEFYSSHTCKDRTGVVICPTLRAYICPLCGATGSNAHTMSYCPLSTTTTRTKHSVRKQSADGFVRYSHGRKYMGNLH
ncbi:hypothetical protein BsWGS_07111 [Bradybaena similaris]